MPELRYNPGESSRHILSHYHTWSSGSVVINVFLEYLYVMSLYTTYVKYGKGIFYFVNWLYTLLFTTGMSEERALLMSSLSVFSL
jgi:hypothetical protein